MAQRLRPCRPRCTRQCGQVCLIPGLGQVCRASRLRNTALTVCADAPRVTALQPPFGKVTAAVYGHRQQGAFPLGHTGTRSGVMVDGTLQLVGLLRLRELRCRLLLQTQGLLATLVRKLFSPVGCLHIEKQRITRFAIAVLLASAVLPTVMTGQHDLTTDCALTAQGRALRLEYPERSAISVFDADTNAQAMRKPGHNRPLHGFGELRIARACQQQCRLPCELTAHHLAGGGCKRHVHRCFTPPHGIQRLFANASVAQQRAHYLVIQGLKHRRQHAAHSL